MDTSLIKLIVPEYILKHFEYEKVEEIIGVMHIHLLQRAYLSHYPKGFIGKGILLFFLIKYCLFS